MAKDNPSVKEALIDNRAKEIRESHEQTSVLKAVADKLDVISKNDKDAKEAFIDLMTQDGTSTPEAIKDMSTEVSDAIQTIKPRKSVVELQKKSDKTIIDVVPDVSKEQTQKQVLGALTNLVNIFPNLSKGLSYVAERTDAVAEIMGISKSIFENIFIEISNMVTAIEHLAKVLMDHFIPKDPFVPFEKIPFMERFKKALFRLGEDIQKGWKKWAPVDAQIIANPLFAYIGKSIQEVSTVLGGVLTPLFSFFGTLIKILGPFKYILAGGAIFLVISSLFNFTSDFTKTGESITKLLSDFSFDNLKNVFTSLVGDLSSMFSSTQESSALVKSLADLWTNQLAPTFDYIVNGVLLPFANEMKRIFADELMPRFQAFIDYMRGPEGASIIEGIKSFAAFLTDVLVFLFAKVLPPILDAIGFILKGLVESVKVLWPEILNLTSALTNFAINFISSIYEFIKDLFTSFATLSSASDVQNTLLENMGLMAKGLAQLVLTVFKFIFNFYDSIASFWVQFTGIDDMLGMHGAKVSEMFMALFQFIGNKVKEFGNFVVDKVIEGFKTLTELDFVKSIIDKVKSMFDYILDMIPTVDSLKEMLKSAAESIPGGKWLIDNVISPEVQQTNVTPTNVMAAGEARNATNSILNNMDQWDKNKPSSSPTVIVAPSSQTVVQTSPARASSGGLFGVAKTTQTQTPSDKHLYGTR